MLVTINTAVTKNFQKLANKLLKTALKLTKAKTNKVSIDISFVDEEEIKNLNSEFRKIDKATDVLSFPTLTITPFEKIVVKDHLEDYNYQTKHLHLGDIIICEDVAKRQAKDYGHSYERELFYLIVHGYLHLLGFDHIKEQDKIAMRGLEEQILAKYHITRNIEG